MEELAERPDAETWDVSVVVPARDAAWCLPDQLAALAAQRTVHRFEVIVADNGSRDATADVARRCGARVVDASATRGPGYARNCGARAARGRHLLFLDADDVVDPSYVDHMVNALEHADMVGARVEQAELNPGWTAEVRTVAQQSDLPVVNVAGEDLPWIYCATLGIRRETFERMGGFDESLISGEDVDLSIRARWSGLRLDFARAALLHCRLPHTLPAVFRQGLKYGAGGARVEAKYRRLGRPIDHVITDRSARLRFGLGPLRHLVRARSRAEFGSALFLIGRRAGYFALTLRAAAPGTGADVTDSRLAPDGPSRT